MQVWRKEYVSWLTVLKLQVNVDTVAAGGGIGKAFQSLCVPGIEGHFGVDVFYVAVNHPKVTANKRNGTVGKAQSFHPFLRETVTQSHFPQLDERSVENIGFVNGAEGLIVLLGGYDFRVVFSIFGNAVENHSIIINRFICR